MNVSMGQLVNDAKELVLRLKEREKNVDQVVVQSNALAKKVDAIQQLETELMTINEKANHRSKVAVLSSIQKENKVIKLLQQENEDLKESLEEHQSVLEIIMSKYRQQMLQLIRLKKQQELSEDFYQSAVFKSLQEKTDQIAEMTEIMKHAVNVDEQAMNETEERLQSLIVENRGLKEMLKIKSKYGAYEPNNNNNNNNIVMNNNQAQHSNLVDREVQTEKFPTEGGSDELVTAKQQEDKLEISKLMDLLVLNTEKAKEKPAVEETEEILINKFDEILENESVNETTVLQSIENLGDDKSNITEHQKMAKVLESVSFNTSLQSVPVVVDFDENKSDSVINEQTAIEVTCSSSTSEGPEDHETNKPTSDTENAKPNSGAQGVTYKTEMIIKNVHATASPEKSTTQSTKVDIEEGHETVN